jgi:prepilin-type N-terminal cleavage/methylation domain-containing protein
MIKGFSLLEILVVLALMSVLLPMIISSVVASTRCSQKIINNQQRMEAIFHTVDTIRSDLTKCGMRLQEASHTFGFPMFEHSDQSLKVLYGVEQETLTNDCWEGDNGIFINRNDFFTKGKRVLIYDSESSKYEFNEIKDRDGDCLILSQVLQNNYSKNAVAVVIKEVEYKIYLKQKALKRKVNKGYFQPLIEEVTDFNIKFYPESSSVFYRIEINHKEQIRGYIFLVNMVAK